MTVGGGGVIAKRPRRTFASFADLGVDLQLRVFAFLSIKDAHNALLSSLPRRDARSSLRSDLRRRFNALEEVHKLKKHGKPSITPLAFASMRTLTVKLPPSGVLPDGVAQLYDLRSLTVLHRKDVPTVDNGLAALSFCCRLRTLTIRKHRFTSLPAAVCKLSTLEELDLTGCKELRALPTNFGKRLKCLKSLNLDGCIALRDMPLSVLRALEGNAKKHRRKTNRLNLTASAFPRGYLRQRITKRRFPRLAADCELLIAENERINEEDADGTASESSNASG